MNRTSNYHIKYELMDIEGIANAVKVVPTEYINEDGDYINDSFLSLGGVKVFFPLLIPEHSLPEEMRLSHSLPGTVCF